MRQRLDNLPVICYKQIESGESLALLSAKGHDMGKTENASEKLARLKQEALDSFDELARQHDARLTAQGERLAKECSPLGQQLLDQIQAGYRDSVASLRVSLVQKLG
jgi:hypothetical protein